ncbi:3258_t:CDS:2 [Funneliformis geosporum]|uniref:3258_t:CDS:1 n=1 Tax=Funneliformis geosporum TaxID=1117311 RepID=A0A9W4T6J6_9GLOM|nr:3258_t:CDS:2 [Funneliformis geosporum]
MYSFIRDFIGLFQGLDELFIIAGQLWPVNNYDKRALMASEQ